MLVTISMLLSLIVIFFLKIGWRNYEKE